MEMTPHETRVHRSGFPRDLRDERHQAELSGPVVTYKAIEELLPKRPIGRLFVTFYGARGQCLYVSEDATKHLLAAGADRARIQFDNLNRRLIITPDPDGPWAMTPRGATLLMGSTSLRDALLAKGMRPGRYLARTQGQSLVVEVGR